MTSIREYTPSVSERRKGAEQGKATDQYWLGRMYQNGNGVPQDDAEAVKWYRKAAEGYRKEAEQGNMYYQYALGEMYQKGDGVPQDDTEAVITSAI
jgi:hypothetical protein